MKQALQLKLGQQLTLTPQLQQAIKLLQLSTLDLQQTISETLESNPLLDEEELIAEPVDDDIRESVDFSDSVSDAIPGTELQVDAAWEDVMPSAAPPSSGMSAGSDDLARSSDPALIPEEGGAAEGMTSSHAASTWSSVPGMASLTLSEKSTLSRISSSTGSAISSSSSRSGLLSSVSEMVC